MGRCPGSSSVWFLRPDKVGVFISVGQGGKSEGHNQEKQRHPDFYTLCLLTFMLKGISDCISRSLRALLSQICRSTCRRHRGMTSEVQYAVP